MRILSYNINGIRAGMKNGFADWLKRRKYDVICLQEIKALPEQVDTTPFEKMGYEMYWYPAEKKGYSGVAIFTKITPSHVEYGCGIKQFDQEGRVIRADFGDLSIMSAYFPSGSSGEIRQEVKMKFLSKFLPYIKKVRKERPKIIVSGDYNICHKEIDIHDPVRNKKSSGFLPEEREWMEKYFKSGMIDTFRYFNDKPDRYSWWSYRSGARAKNKGWRIDYQAASEALESSLKKADILDKAVHSDHCPTFLELK